MEPTTLLGTAAGVLTTLAFLPQVARIVRSRSAEDISAWSFLVLAAGLSLWTAYGALTRSAPIVVFNAVTLALAVTVLVLKARFRRR